METERDVRNDNPQFSLRWLLFAIAAFAIFFAGIRFAQRVLEVPNDAYAMWAAGDVLLDYMTANNADWPDSWDSLADFHSASGNTTTMVGPFAAMQDRVFIDFNFDPHATLSAMSPDDVSPDFRVVTLRDGGDTHWSGMEPNQRVFDHLKQLKFGTTTNTSGP